MTIGGMICRLFTPIEASGFGACADRSSPCFVES